MRQLLTMFVDLFFPPSPAEKILRETSVDTMQEFYRPGTYKNNTYLCRYKEPLIQAAITDNKFHHRQKAARLLVHLLEQWLKNNHQQILFVPIPLGKQRLRQRGHNQVETILRASALPLHIDTTLLKRSIETQPQSKLQKQARLQNMQNVFCCTPGKFESSTTHVVLVDDVVTTGATMAAARAALAPHLPPHVHLRCLAIAH